MIRRLRWKVVGLNMGMVFCVLLAVFAAVFFFARSALSRSVRQQMEEAVRTGVYDLSQPDGSTLPCAICGAWGFCPPASPLPTARWSRPPSAAC